MRILFTNIAGLAGVRTENKLLRGAELASLPVIENAWLVIEDGLVAGYGPMSELRFNPSHFKEHYDLQGSFMLPAWCDSHTHLVFASGRENEFVDKIRGLSYSEIAARGGGILNSAKKISELSENELYDLSYKRLQHVMKLGTGAIEIKSGYGLSVEGELKMLRVIRRLQASAPIPIRSTFLGAHTYPLMYKENHDQYINMIIDEMLPVIAREKLADYIDVFCEEGFFSPAETEKICRAGMQYGLKPKLHVNQLNSIGGIETGLRIGAVSLDHLEVMTENDIKLLAQETSAGGDQVTIGTLLPTAAFFLRMNYQPARKLIDNNCAVALASDFNPGSSPSGNMNFVVALSCIQMRMLPEEAINAATINGAYAMEVQGQVGSITIGKRANLIVTRKISSLACLPYSFGDNLIERVMISGNWL